MLKKRIIVLLTLYDGVLFRTKKFVPDYRYTLNFVDLDHVDEVVILDVGGERANFYKTVREFTDKCQVPLSVGGRIDSLEGVNRLFGELPIEKVVIERVLAKDPQLVVRIAERWGSQAVCVGITDGRPGFFIGEEGLLCSQSAAGEILFQSEGRDGSLMGYDISRLETVMKFFPKTPVIAGSGCGTWKHMLEAFEAGADACATSCIHHFPANAIKGFKKNLSEHGVPIRP